MLHQTDPQLDSSSPADTIATLLRFVALEPSDNLVDCALALPTDPGIISSVALYGVPDAINGTFVVSGRTYVKQISFSRMTEPATAGRVTC